MKVFVIFLVLIGLVGLVYADEEPQVPEPTPTCPEGTTLNDNNSCIGGEPICGEGTTYQDGICVVDKIKNSTEIPTDPSKRWGGPYTFDIDSPLKQFQSGIPFSEIKCNSNLQLTQRYDGTPACVTSETYYELIKRNWVSNIILAIQSRDIFATENMASSYINKIIPTIDDFRKTLYESYDIDTIFSKFGKPHNDIGSGIHIYEYVLNDFTKVWIGYTDHIWYVYHVDNDGNILEKLFVENENKTFDFKTQYTIAKQIYMSIPKTADSPYLGMTYGEDRKSILIGIDIEKLTAEKNQQYYEKLFEDKFAEITIPYEIRFQKNLGGDE